MKFIKMMRDIDGAELSGNVGVGDYRARYVRADVLDEIVIVQSTCMEVGGTESPFYEVIGVRYNAPDETYYDIAGFGTLADAEKFLADLIADINSEATS